MDPNEELLAKLQAIDGEATPPKPTLTPVTPPPRSAPPTNASANTDDFLAQLAALDQATRPAPAPVPPPVPTPPQPAAPATQRPPSPAPVSGIAQPGQSPAAISIVVPALSNAIERLKQFTQAQLEAHAAENRAKVQRAQEVARAQAWLDTLDPLSDDGFWFEQFAEGYASRLEAALIFLDPGRAET